MRWTRYAFHSKAMSRHGRAVPQYLYVVRTTILMLVPTPTFNAIFSGSFDVPSEIGLSGFLLKVIECLQQGHRKNEKYVLFEHA